MFGYARPTRPPILIRGRGAGDLARGSHALTRRLADMRKDGTLPWLRPDGKSQVSVEYDQGARGKIHTVVVSDPDGGRERGLSGGDPGTDPVRT